jgi:type IV pilus secretin PilQ/predicted competence protein
MTATKLTIRLAGLCALAAVMLLTTAAAAQEANGPPVKRTDGNTFDIHAKGTDLRSVLQMLSTQGRRNIVATKEVQGQVTADLYSVTFHEALEAVLRSTGFVHHEQDGFIYVYTPEQLAEIEAAQRQMGTKVFRLNYITAEDAQSLIAPAMSDDGTVAVTPSAGAGVGTSDSDAGGVDYATGDMLIVRDYEDCLEQIEAILSEVDTKPDQVLIEATLMRATLTEDNHLGIDFNTLAGIDFETMGSTSAGVGDLTTGDLASADLPQNKVFSTLRTDFNSTVPTGGFTFGILSNEIGFFIRALESITDVTILANPKLLVINKQRGEVMVGNRDGYLTTTVTETVATETVEFLETGTRLVVRPYIGKDGFVRMEIHPEDSSGSVEQVGSSVLPSETTTEVTTNVLVRDGHTIVIGGLFREVLNATRGQVPGLGNIPYLGAAFRQTHDNTDREEIIIAITPHIVKQDAAEEIGDQTVADMERYRIGSRKGMRWWGRTRLAEKCVRNAKQALALSDTDRAMWFLDMALSMRPRMEEAVRMKERLTQQAYWSDHVQDSISRYLVRRIIMHELGKPATRVVPPARPRDTEKLSPEVREKLGIGPRHEDPLPGQPPVLPEVKLEEPSRPGEPPAPRAVEPEEPTAGETVKPEPVAEEPESVEADAAADEPVEPEAEATEPEASEPTAMQPVPIAPEPEASAEPEPAPAEPAPAETDAEEGEPVEADAEATEPVEADAESEDQGETVGWSIKELFIASERSGA